MDTSLFGYFLFWICIIGLCFGSFYNVVILRSLSNESIVFPSSKCPKCGHQLYWWHNIPVLSYIILKGKCYFCKEKISFQYPLIEIITMFLFALTFIKFGISLLTLFVLIWISGLLIMTMTDLKEKLVDCNIAIIIAVSGLIYNLISASWNGVIDSILGLIAGILVFEIIARLGYLVVKSRAMGEADTYVAAALGAIFGIKALPWILLYSLAASMIFIIPMFLYNRYKACDKPVLIFSILFTLSVLIFKTVSENWLTFSLVALFGLILSILILKSLKTSEERIYLPFVPAFFAGTLYFMFFVL